VPGGVVNILTGRPSELFSHFASHMDVNAVIYCGGDALIQKDMQQKAAGNVKRVLIHQDVNWLSEKGQSPYFVLDTQEIKTTWHPIENIGGGGGGY
jgi:acyl-CoA reductase-like NAD-dependent aldehyde dehydrogenase